MIIEAAILNVKSGKGRAFEDAMREAKPLIEATPGFEKMEVRPCVETRDRYILLVWWSSVEAHTQGFRQSERYAAWREKLHHFYDPFPVVQHFKEPI